MKSGSPLKATPRSHTLPRWQLQAARAHFSEVVRRAQAEGPQLVTHRGKDAVVILAAEEFERLTARGRQPESLAKFFTESPLAEAGFVLKRNPDYGRDIE